MNNKITNEQSVYSKSFYKEYINDLVEQKLKNQTKFTEPSFFEKTLCIVGSICIIILVIFICIIIYKNNFTAESILSTLLAFFSIFISIFFYFKADETSSKFYDSSYKFMKDNSVTLGKIEERFGEKLNNLNDKVSHLDEKSKEAEEQIENKQEDKDRLIDELFEKANLSEAQRKKYKDDLDNKDDEIEKLRIQRINAEREANFLRKKMSNFPIQEKIFIKDPYYNEYNDSIDNFATELNQYLQNNKKISNEFSFTSKKNTKNK